MGVIGMPWEEFRQRDTYEKTIHHENFRVIAVKTPKLLVIPDHVSRLYRLYSGNSHALTIKQIKHLAPDFCGILPGPHERFRFGTESLMDSHLFFAQRVPGSSLKDIASSKDGYMKIKGVVKELFQALPIIHKHWGFHGGIDRDGVFFDEATRKITILNWDHGQLPLYHITGYQDGNVN